MNLESLVVAYQELVVFGHFKRNASSEVTRVDVAFQVVHVHRPMYLKALPMSLKRDRIPDPRPRTVHDLRTVHEVINHVFKNWHQCLTVHQVEEYSVICRYLHPLVVLVVANKPSALYLVVTLPPVLVDILVPLQFEK
jgi:hypothetical protein